MPGGGGSSTTTSEPWEGVKEPLLAGYERAEDLYNLGGPQYYPGQTLASIPWQLSSAHDLLTQRALAGSPVTDQAQRQATDTLAGNYLYSNPALAALQPFASGQFTGSNPLYGLAGGIASGQGLNPALAMMRQTAQGDYVGANPYLDAMYQRASAPVTQQFMQQVLPGITSQFAAGNRLGGGPDSLQGETIGMATDALGRTLGDMSANIYGINYAQERQLMEQAQQNYGNLFNAGQGLQLSAAGLLGNTYANELGLQLSGAQGLSQPYQAERDLMAKYSLMAPSLAGQDYFDIGQLAQAGTNIQGMEQAAINDAISRYNYNQQLPYNNLSQYFSYLNGVPTSGYGSATSPTYSNPLAGAAGGAMLGSQLMPGLGTGLGALAGLLMSW